MLVAGALAALASAANAVDADDHDLVMDFASKPWLHHAGPVVGDSIAYQYAQPLEAGEPFTVTIDWSGSAAPGRPAIAQLVAPSLHAFGGPEALVTSQGAPLPAGIQAFSLEVPAALAKGMYYVTVAGQPAGGDSVSQVLQPVFSSGSPAPVGQPIWARIHDDIELRSVHVKHDRDDRLTVAFDWAAVRPIAAKRSRTFPA